LKDHIGLGGSTLEEMSDRKIEIEKKRSREEIL
jgi:hypothetical protein